MKKLNKYIVITTLTMFIVGFALSYGYMWINKPLEEFTTVETVPVIVSEPREVEAFSLEKTTTETIEQLYIDKMAELETTGNKERWYVEYKYLIEEYSQYYEDIPENIYDYFSEEELDLLFRVVQAEAGDEYGFDEKANVASVIFNRYHHEEFNANSLFDILNSQFSCIADSRYMEVEVSNTTIWACEYAFSIEDTTDGCLAFRNDSKPNKWCKWTYSFQDDAHYFYK